MPNRILKESICTSETINRLTIEQENFFYRLLVVCDDYGRMDARPAILRARCYPLRIDTVSEQTIESLVAALERAGLIRRYSVDGHVYLQVITWDKHQQIRAKRSKYPAPPDNLQSSDIICNQVQEHVSTCPRNPNPNPIRESESGSSSSPAAPTAPSHPATLKIFPESSYEYQLAHLLREKILENNPRAKVPGPSPGALARWCREFDLMIRVDGRSPPEIREVIRWCQADPFWRANVLSAAKLRQKWDTLWLQMQRPTKEAYRGVNQAGAGPSPAAAESECKPGKYAGVRRLNDLPDVRRNALPREASP